MFKTLRLPALVAAFCLAFAPVVSLVGVPTAMAQTQPAAPAAPAAATPDATAPAADTPADITAPDTTVAVENPYGLGALWNGGGVIARSTLAILVIMSISTWYVMITKLYEQSRLLSQARAANKTFWAGTSIESSVNTLKAGSPFRYIAENGVKATEHHEGTMVEQIDLNTWVTMSIQRAADEVASRLQGGLAVLATVGSTAPFVGLFGTVWGIYNALIAIGLSGQASIDKVAGPVGEALIMTAIGLAVAVPAVLGYNWLVRRNKTAMERVRTFSADLHSVLLSGTRVSSTPSVSRIA
jgi:biopolymer transport protein ExbB